MRKYTIAHFMRYKSPYRGNFIESILNLEKNLKEQNTDIIYFFIKETEKREWAQELSASGRKVYFISGNLLNDILLIRKIIITKNIKIIHTHFIGSNDYILLKLAIIFSFRNIKLITHGHNHFNNSSNRIINYIKNKIYKSDIYIGCSKSVANKYIISGFEEARVKTIMNAINFERLESYNEINREDLKVENKRTILLFGFDYYRKGVDLVLQALNEIHQNNNIVLLISISSNKDKILNEIMNLFGEIPKWVILLDAREDVAAYYKISDVFISASREEGFCYSLVEAAYCGCSVILSDIPGQNSLDIPNSILYEVDNREALQEAILKKINIDKKEKQKEWQINKEFVESKYNINKWSEEIICVYNDIIK